MNHLHRASIMPSSLTEFLDNLLSVPEDAPALKVVILVTITNVARQLNVLGLGVTRV